MDTLRRALMLSIALVAAVPLVAQASNPATGQPNATYLAALAGQPLPTVHYTLDLTHPNDHLAAVTLTAPSTGAATRVEMPAWYPGRYTIYNYAVNVQQPAAACAATGAALPFHRVDPNTWEVENGTCAAIEWRYRVYGNVPLNGSFFQVDAAHANLNGGPVYMYVAGQKPNPVTLDIRAPQGWEVLNELGQPNQSHLWFPNYDIFIDAPTEAAPNFTLDQFQADGKTYRVLIHDFASIDGRGSQRGLAARPASARTDLGTPQPQAGAARAASNAANRAELLEGLKKIVETENAVVAPDELDTYTFFFHFDPGSSDGMEHLFGTQIMIPAGLGTENGLHGAFDDAAHEFFHQWNVKRIRPAALGPWNYEAPNPTPSLWVAEGFTQYYGDISLERAGLESSDQYLAGLGRSLGNSLFGSGYKLMSAEDSSLTALFHDATPLRQDTNEGITTISYYGRGEQIAAMLDLDLRARTGGKKSLNDVMRWLWTNTYHAPRATYYLPGRGYTDLDVQHAIEAVAGAGASYADFFRDYVAGTKAMDYDRYLANAGLKLACSVPENMKNYTGLHLAGATVRGVDPGSPAEAAGFGNAMELTSMDAEQLRALAPGRGVRVEATAHGAQLTLRLTPEAPRASACTLAEVPGASAAQITLRAAWLSGK